MLPWDLHLHSFASQILDFEGTKATVIRLLEEAEAPNRGLRRDTAFGKKMFTTNQPGLEISGRNSSWLAKLYKYADGVPWNQDRYELFVRSDGQLVSVGGAMRTWSGRTIAFLCRKGINRRIRTPGAVESDTHGLYVWGDSVKAALVALKSKYSDPESILQGFDDREMAAF